MPAREPHWWYGEGAHWQTRALAPVAALYGYMAQRRFRSTVPYRARCPVLCVGNFTAGGSGKTPLAIALAKRVTALGGEPWFLTRGYGGRLKGPHRVALGADSAVDVGDEALLLARHAPVVIAADRAAGVRSIEKLAGANAAIIMDDGLQNPTVAKDLSLAVVDFGRGFGNAHVIPAGPLRAPLNFQINLVDVLVVSSVSDKGLAPGWLAVLRRARDMPCVTSVTEPVGDTGWLSGQRVVAFAGIANPERVFRTLEALGAEVVATRTFTDHAHLTAAEARALLRLAEQHQALLVTTEKDLVRMAGATGPVGDLLGSARAVPIAARITGGETEAFDALLANALRR